MATTKPAFQRARTPENKERRTDALVDAARELAIRGGVRAVTLTEIAAAAGVHLSGVRRYFESREEIFLRLTAEGWRDWADVVCAELADGTFSARELSAVLARTLADRPLFCDLLGHAPLSLERQVSVEPVREFKLTALAALDDLITAITRATPEIARADAQDLIAAVSGLAAMLWQVSHPPETLAQLYREDPRLAHAVVDFVPRLTRLIHVTAVGLVAVACKA